MEPEPDTEFLLYTTDDGRSRIDVRLLDETVWLTQAQMADLFQKSIPTVNEHIKNVYDEGELFKDATIRKFRIVRMEGKREVARDIEHYNLDVIISVGYRVRSHRGTQFRQWATRTLKEFLIKGFAIDDKRLAERRTTDKYFDELIERVRAIRTSEANFYAKITDIYATSVDYDKDSPMSRDFFATVQNKIHYAIHGQTAAEVIHSRADALENRQQTGCLGGSLGGGGPLVCAISCGQPP